MRELNLPDYSFKLKSEEHQDYIFDPFRRKYVKLTPEEWVRQNFAAYLVNDRGYPSSRMITEKSLTFNKMMKRCDILAYDSSGQPLLMVECKAPDVKLGPEVFDQVSVYNVVFRVAYLIITNGLKHYCSKVDFGTRSISFLSEIPSYNEIDV